MAKLVARVFMPERGYTQFKFQDCVADYVTGHDPPEGYAKNPSRDKYTGHVHQHVSYVAGLVLGGIECTVYLAQFKIPCEQGESVHFYASPEDILTACVQAIAEERCPPEYVI